MSKIVVFKYSSFLINNYLIKKKEYLTIYKIDIKLKKWEIYYVLKKIDKMLKFKSIKTKISKISKSLNKYLKNFNINFSHLL